MTALRKRSLMFVKRASALCLLLMVCGGCAVAPKTADRTRFVSAQGALEHAAARMPADAVLQALADVLVTTPEGEVHPLRLALLMQKPASLRVEAVPFFGPPSFFLTISERTLRVFLAGNRTFYTGRATPENVARHLGVNLAPEELVAVLTGGFFLPAGPNTITQFPPENGLYRIDIATPPTLRSLWVRASDGFLTRIEVFGQQQRLYRVLFEEPLLVADTLLPRRITFVSEGIDGVSASIRYADLQLLKDIEPGTFDLRAPPGVEALSLD